MDTHKLVFFDISTRGNIYRYQCINPLLFAYLELNNKYLNICFYLRTGRKMSKLFCGISLIMEITDIYQLNISFYLYTWRIMNKYMLHIFFYLHINMPGTKE